MGTGTSYLGLIALLALAAPVAHADALLMIVLHTVDHRAVFINPLQVVSISEAGASVSEETHCTLTFSNGKFIAVVEECDNVRKRLEEVKPR